MVVGELDAVIRQRRVDRVRHGGDQIVQKGCRDPLSRFLMQLNECKLARAIDGHEQVQLALFRADLRDVDVKVADRVGLEAQALVLVAVHIRQATDAVTLQAAVE